MSVWQISFIFIWDEPKILGAGSVYSQPMYIYLLVVIENWYDPNLSRPTLLSMLLCSLLNSQFPSFFDIGISGCLFFDVVNFWISLALQWSLYILYTIKYYNLITVIAMHENFKHTYEYSPARMRLGLRVSPTCFKIVNSVPWLRSRQPLRVFEELKYLFLSRSTYYWWTPYF